MSLFDGFKKMLSGTPSPAPDNAAPSSSSAPDEGQIQDVQTTAPGKLSLDDKKDFDLLVSIYKKHKADSEINFQALVRTLNPDATPHMCPYCRTVHEFTATRARKCPTCSKKMVVRQGLFITEDQAAQMEGLIQKSYTKQSLVMKVGFNLESAQSSKVNKRKTDQLRSIAEAFRYTAQIENHKDGEGYSFWDKAWGYYGKARLEEMRNRDLSMIQYSSLPDIIWDMTQMLLDQANSKLTDDAKKRDKKMALHYACMTLAESARLGTDIYYAPQLYTFAKERVTELGMTSEELSSLTSSVGSKMRLTGESANRYDAYIRDLVAYEVIRPFQP